MHAPQCLILRSTRGIATLVFYHVQAQHGDPPGDTDCSSQTLQSARGARTDNWFADHQIPVID